jgi:NADH-quinone oxidoreductase subunit D
MVRRKEIDESIKIVRQLINNMPKGEYKNQWYNPFKFFLPEGSVYTKIESSKGEYGYYFVSNGGDKPYRVNVRGASYTHSITIFKELVKGARIEDVALILFSLDACPPEVDR